MLIVQMSVLAPRVVAADLGVAAGVHAPCADAAQREACEPCPGCPASHCANPHCLNFCVAGAIAPATVPVVLSTTSHVSPAPAFVPSPADLAQPPLHPPPILL